MAGAAASEVSPVVFGDVYCTAIEGCQEISDVGPGGGVDVGAAPLVR